MTTATAPVPAGLPGTHSPGATPHRWQFIRAGGVDQVVFRGGADLARIAELDQKLWVALACPTRGIDFDARTLDLIDTDGDGRVRPPEVIAACQWACERLRSADVLLAGPLAGRDDLGRSHATVAVGVDEVERASIEVDAARGAGECDPQFLVEFGDACDVLAAAEHHLVHAAGTDELPAVRRRAWRVGAGKVGGNGGGGGRQRADVLGMVVRDRECLKRGLRASCTTQRLQFVGVSLDRATRRS